MLTILMSRRRQTVRSVRGHIARGQSRVRHWPGIAESLSINGTSRRDVTGHVPESTHVIAARRLNEEARTDA